jgi:hypothetical protein
MGGSESRMTKKMREFTLDEQAEMEQVRFPFYVAVTLMQEGYTPDEIAASMQVTPDEFNRDFTEHMARIATTVPRDELDKVIEEGRKLMVKDIGLVVMSFKAPPKS